MQLTEEHDLIRSLTEMISVYMSRNSQLTLNALASRSNVPVTTLRRLMSGQQKNEIAPQVNEREMILLPDDNKEFHLVVDSYLNTKEVRR